MTTTATLESPLWITNLPRDEVNDFKNETAWLDITVGRPQATHVHTVEQLEVMGFVGVYRTSDRQS